MAILLDDLKGLKVPVKTTTEKNAIVSPETGAILFDSTLGMLCQYNGSSWDTFAAPYIPPTSWTPTIYAVSNITGGTGGVTINSAKYVKVGRLCHFYINANITVTTGGTTAYFTFDTPFTHDAAASPSCGGAGAGQSYYPWSIVDEGGGTSDRLALVSYAPPAGVHSIQFGGFFFTA
jgi:hypothetical protein